jgi:hypothetical protein
MAIGPSGTAVGKMIEAKKKKKMPFMKAKNTPEMKSGGASKGAGMKLMNAREV